MQHADWLIEHLPTLKRADKAANAFYNNIYLLNPESTVPDHSHPKVLPIRAAMPLMHLSH